MSMEYRIELPDPYQNAYERVIMEFEHRMRSREMEGLEAALKEYGYIKERTCKLRKAAWNNGTCTWGVVCSSCGKGFEHESGRAWNYCPSCGAKVVG